MQAPTNVIACSTESGIVGEHLATRLNVVDISNGLLFAPSAEDIASDAEQIDFCSARVTKRGHRLASRRRQVQRFPHTVEDIALRDAARIAFVDGAT